MSQNTARPTNSDAKVKRSRWKFFPKERSKSPEMTPPEANSTASIPHSTDSTYGSSGANSAHPSENESSVQSLGLPKKSSAQNLVSPVSPPQPGPGLAPPQAGPTPPQPGLLSPKDAITQSHDRGQANGDITVTSPTIRKETHHDPATGTAVTTIITTTTTTTTIVGANGTTVIEEPRAELGDGRRTPDPSEHSEAITAAIIGKGDGNLQSRFGDQQTQPVPGQWNPITPGRRPIPQRDPNNPNSSMTDLRRPNVEDHNQPPAMQHEPAAPSLPPRGSNIYSVPRKDVPSPQSNGASGGQSGQGVMSSLTGALRNFSYPTKNESQNWAQTPQALRPGQPPPQKEPNSTLGNLKMAAAGLHGAGEALRGTISQTADRRIPGGKASDVKMQQHQEVINKGRYEIENRRLAHHNTALGAEQGRYPNQPSLPQSFNTPEPDAQPTHLELQRRRFSSGYTAQPLSPKGPAPVKSGLGKWLRKSSSHPSDKQKGASLRDGGTPPQVDNKKLKRRSKTPLGSVAE